MCVALCFNVSSFSQNTDKTDFLFPVNQATLFGIGKSFITDTYLSPLEYNGVSYSMLHERFKRTKWLHAKLHTQQQFQIEIAATKNPQKTASAYFGNIAYDLHGFYPLFSKNSFRLLGGVGWNFSLGGIYNVRNSNNPGSLKLATNFTLSALAFYNWRYFTLRWQLSSPFAGIFFCPEYGHSYYEIFTLGNNDGTVHFSSLHNQTALKNYMTVDFPIHNFTLRVGYLGSYYRTHVNNITTRLVSHQLMIGLAMESINFGGKRIRKSKWLKSSYY